MTNSPSSPAADRWATVLWVFSAMNVGNAVWMLLQPAHWYTNLPADVPNTGPLNRHFVQDIGVAFLAAGVALGWAARDRRFRFPLLVVATIFIGGHALVHVQDVLRGASDFDHVLLDLPGVYLPAVLLAVATVQSRRHPWPA